MKKKVSELMGGDFFIYKENMVRVFACDQFNAKKHVVRVMSVDGSNRVISGTGKELKLLSSQDIEVLDSYEMRKANK